MSAVVNPGARLPVKLYGAGSSNVMKIVLMLEELGIDHDFELVNVWRGEQFEDRIRSLNPNCKLPVLVDARVSGEPPAVVFESGAILLHLAEQSGRFLAPTGALRRETMQWLFLQVSGLGPALGQHIHFTRFSPNVSAYAEGRYRTAAVRLIDVYESRLSTRDYLCGDALTIADIAAYPWLCRLEELKLPADRPGIARWCERIGARPAALAMQAMAKQVRGQSLAARSQADPTDLDRLFGRGAFEHMAT